MSKRYSIAEARNNFAAIVHELDQTEIVEITRRGCAVAVLLSKQEYDKLQVRKTGFWEAYKSFAKEVNLSQLEIEPAEIFGRLRDPDAGRMAKF